MSRSFVGSARRSHPSALAGISCTNTGKCAHFPPPVLTVSDIPEPVDIDFGNKIFRRPARFYKINNGKYYYLLENEDEEIWELHKMDIKLK